MQRSAMESNKTPMLNCKNFVKQSNTLVYFVNLFSKSIESQSTSGWNSINLWPELLIWFQSQNQGTHSAEFDIGTEYDKRDIFVEYGLKGKFMSIKYLIDFNGFLFDLVQILVCFGPWVKGMNTMGWTRIEGGRGGIGRSVLTALTAEKFQPQENIFPVNTVLG